MHDIRKTKLKYGLRNSIECGLSGWKSTKQILLFNDLDVARNQRRTNNFCATDFFLSSFLLAVHFFLPLAVAVQYNTNGISDQRLSDWVDESIFLFFSLRAVCVRLWLPETGRIDMAVWCVV